MSHPTLSSPLPRPAPGTSSAYLPPSAPPAFLQHLIVSSLLRRGYDGAEAGALGEIERLLEKHINHVLQDARDYANLSGRRDVHAGDVAAAYDCVAGGSWSGGAGGVGSAANANASGSGSAGAGVSVSASAGGSRPAVKAEIRRRSVRGMRKEAKRRRRALGLQTAPSPPPSPPPSPTSSALTLADLIRQESDRPATDADGEQEDRKPQLAALERGGSGVQGGKGGKRLAVAEGWMPVLPEKWTLEAAGELQPPTEKKPPSELPQVTSTLLDFIKLTAAERGDIPPELGLVDYRREGGGSGGKGIGAGAGAGAGAGKKRKWGVKAAAR
ncbi:hypothetical protein IAT38_005984 [Cryptococcus sp. DSM 104549]